MEKLLDEFVSLKRHDFRLDFTYPTDEILSKLRIVHRDLSPADKARLERQIKGFEQAIDGIVSGELDLDDVASSLEKLDAEKRAELLRLLEGRK
jgi:superfamily I DNA and RNA helicase